MSIVPLTDADLVLTMRALRDGEKQGLERAVIAERFGIKASSFRSRVREAKARGLTADTKMMDEADRLRIELAETRRELRATQHEADTAERIRGLIHGLPMPSTDLPPWLNRTAGQAGHDLPGVPMVFWSDWHYGERVFKEQVNRVNEFNPEVAAERVQRLVDKIELLAIKYTVRPEYPGIVVALGGDMITGDIHEELRETNAVPTQVALLDVENLLIRALTRMADLFGNVFVPCVVGNHGRNTLRPRAKNRVYTSLEWNLYCHLERHFVSDKRFTFMVPSGADAYFKVFDHRFMLTHGDALGVKGGDGIIGSLGPIARGTFKTARFTAQTRRDFDTLLIGHWHTYIPRGDAVPVIVNGTLKGFDEYAHLMLRAGYAPPSQALWFVHPNIGITSQWNILLDKPKRIKDTRWLSIPSN